MKVFSLLASLLSLGLVSALGGCAATVTSTGTTLPWWVASPDAPLPKGFPPPGPLDEVVIKQYPVYRSAVAQSKGGNSADGMFFPLFNHIEKNKIAMSAPVEITYTAPGTAASPPPNSMAFIYSENSLGKPGDDGPVKVVDFPAITVASLAVTGSYDSRNFAQAYARLDAWLTAHAAEYTRVGEPRFLAYNGPFVLPFSKYGEVQVPVRPVK